MLHGVGTLLMLNLLGCLVELLYCHFYRFVEDGHLQLGQLSSRLSPGFELFREILPDYSLSVHFYLFQLCLF